MSESFIDDETSECKCVNGPTKDDIALHKKNCDRNTLSNTSINNCKTTTSQNNLIRTTKTPNDNDVISDDLAAPKWKKTSSQHHTIQARFN